MGHGFIGYPKGRNVERALGPSCPCILCIPISGVEQGGLGGGSSPPKILYGGAKPPPQKKSVRRDFNHVNVLLDTVLEWLEC